jgi:hemolysin-activating ACP:hemolysin acyltransferase
MKYIYTTDEHVQSHLLSQGYRFITQQNVASGEKIWVFENNESKPFCFSIDGVNYRQKCLLTDKLTLT